MPSKLYRGCTSSLTPKVLRELFCLGVDDPKDNSCWNETVNTCGISLKDLLESTPIYGPLQDIYSLSPLGLYSYSIGDEVLIISSDGVNVSLYEAIGDVIGASLDINPAQWSLKCNIVLGTKYPTPSLEQLEEAYQYVLEDGPMTYSVGSVVLYEDGISKRVRTLVCINESTINYSTIFPNEDWVEVFYVDKDPFEYSSPTPTKIPLQAYELIQLGSKSDFIEVPKSFVLKSDPSRFCPTE